MRRRRPRKRPRTKILENYQVKFVRDTYLAVDRFVSMGRAKPISRSLAVRGLLDMGLQVWKPEPLPYKAILSEPPFKVTRVMLKPDQVKKLAEIVAKGYAEDLAFNMVMRVGIRQADAMKKIYDERRRLRRAFGEEPSSFSLPGQ